MPGKRLFDTRGAPEEEIDGVRKKLDDYEIDYYETRAGKWGLGNAALWVSDEADYQRARDHVDEFQREWQASARQAPADPGVRWHRVPALIFVIAAVAWVFYKSFQW